MDISLTLNMTNDSKEIFCFMLTRFAENDKALVILKCYFLCYTYKIVILSETKCSEVSINTFYAKLFSCYTDTPCHNEVLYSLSYWANAKYPQRNIKTYFALMDTSLSCESSVWQCKVFLDTSAKASVWQVWSFLSFWAKLRSVW